MIYILNSSIIHWFLFFLYYRLVSFNLFFFTNSYILNIIYHFKYVKLTFYNINKKNVQFVI